MALLPDCIKPPLIDLLLDAVIAVLEGMPSLPMLGLLWPLLKAGVLGFQHALRARDPVTKIKVSNKLAKIISGASPMFLLGFVKGLLEARYSWIKTYEARPEGGEFGICLIASEHLIKRVKQHELGDLAPVELKEYLAADSKIVGEQRTISLEGQNWRDGIPSDLKTPGKELIYTIRDSETGEILKIGKTQGETLEARLQKYVTANNTSGRKVVMDVAEVRLPEGATIESAEDAARQNLLPEARKEAGLGSNGVEEKDVLPWDNTNSRLGREGPGIPGEDTYRLANKGLKWDGEKLVPIDPSNAGPRALVPRGAPQDFQEIVLAFDRKVSDIAQYCNMSDTTVYNWLKAAGL